MNVVKKIIFITFLLVALIFVSLAVFVRIKGKSTIEDRAALMLHRPVNIGTASLAFPWVIRLTDVNVEGLLWADVAEVRCDLMALLGKNFHLASVKLANPILTLHRVQGNQIIWAEHYDEPVSSAVAGTIPKATTKIKAVIDVLTVTNGRLHFPSHDESEPFEASLNDVQLRAVNVPLSGQSMDAGFDFWGTIAGRQAPFAGDHLKGAGFINWPARNMDAVFKVINAEGKIDVEVNLNSKNNDMMVRGHLKTRQMNIKGEANEEKSVEDLLLNAVQSAGMAVNLDFSFPMKMDQWELRNIDFSGNLNASNEGKTGAEQVEDLKTIGQQFKAVGQLLYEKYK